MAAESFFEHAHLLERFESYLRRHALALTTIRNYLADLRAFMRWHRQRHRGRAELKPADFPGYRDHLCASTTHTPATINRHLQSLRLFGRFLHETGALADNPTLQIELVREENDLTPRILTAAETARLETAIRDGRASLVKRDFAIAQLMLAAGLRVQEVASLRQRDAMITRAGVQLAIHDGWGKVQRVIPLNGTAAHALREYIAVRPKLPRVEQVFISQRGQVLSVRSIQRMIGMYARAAGLRGINAQALRHTFARRMLADTRDATLVAERLGYRSTRMVERYARKQGNGQKG